MADERKSKPMPLENTKKATANKKSRPVKPKTSPMPVAKAESKVGEPAKAPEKNLEEGLDQSVDSPSLFNMITGLPGAMAGGAFRLAAKTTDVPLRVGKALFLKPEQAEKMKEAGKMLKDLREVAGLTRFELSEALDLKDHSLIEAVENGTAILSFELILRLAALLARHDPVPVILKFTRTYNPELWKILEDWGLGRLTLHFEREREFINIFRRHDAARKLSDEGFAKVLAFTQAAFEMSLHFIAEQEEVELEEPGEDETEEP